MKKFFDKPSPAACIVLPLLCAALLGSTFVGTKACTNAGLGTFQIIFLRASLCTLLLGICFYREIRHITKADLRAGFLLGIIMLTVYTVETTGVSHAEPTMAAMLINTNIIMAPFLTALLQHGTVKAHSYLSAAIALAGAALLTLTGTAGAGFSAWDILLLIAAAGYTLDNIYASQLCRGNSVPCITFVQFAMLSAYSFVMMLIFGAPGTVTPAVAGAIVYMAAGPMFLGFLIRNYIVVYTGPVRMTILLATQAVFCAVISRILFGETFTVQKVLGMALIFAAILFEVLSGKGTKE